MNFPSFHFAGCGLLRICCAAPFVLPLRAAPVQVSQSDANGSLTSLTTVPAVVLPAVTRHPQPVLASVGGTAVFSVSAGPAVTSYQWRRGVDPVPGGSSDTLRLTGLTAGQFGDYSVTVTNAAGSATSNPATLTLDSDGDGLPDIPNDTDGDRMADDWEQTHFSNLTATAFQDADNDGVTNGDEFTDGTNPRQAASRFFRLALNEGVTAAPALDRYAPGAVVTLTAADRSGLSFIEWSGGLTGFQNPSALTMDADKSVAAVRGTHVLDRTWQGHVTQSDGAVFRLLPLASGKLMAAGRFSACQGVVAQNLVRLNPDLSVDTTFTMSPGTQDSTEVRTLLEQPDGRLVIGGTFSTVNGVQRRFLARLLPDGQLDNTFNSANGVNNQVYAVARLSDGRIAISGHFSQIGATPRSRIALLNADGTLDTTFDPGSGFNDYANSIHVDAGDMLVCGGRFTSYNSLPAGRLVRISVTGQIDAAFNPGGVGADNILDNVRRLPDGRIVITGAFTRYNDTLMSRIAVLNANGALDTSFNPAGNLNNSVLEFLHQADGKFLISGGFNLFGATSRSGIARLHADGTLDTSFNPGAGANNWVWAMSPLAGGRLLLGGQFTQFNAQPRERMVMLDQATGALDTAAIPHAALRGVVWALAVQNDGKLLAGGEFTGVGGRTQNRIARFLPNGMADPGFTPAGMNNQVLALLPLRDGGIMAGGSFTLSGAAPHLRLSRLLPNGMPDPAWPPPPQLDGDVYCLAEDAQGRVLAGGQFNGVTGREQPGLMRFLPDGRVDTSFTAVISRTAAFYDAFADWITVQPDGKILVCGAFDWASGMPATNIARFHADGTPDRSFDALGGANARVRRMLLQPDGKIIVTGEFTIIGGLVRYYIARLLPDGRPDPEFGSTTSGANNVIWDLRPQPGGRMLICGDFTQIAGIPRQRIALLEADGSVVPEFNPGTGPDDNIYAIATDTAGRVYAGGWIREMAATPRAGLLRLTTTPGFDVQMTALIAAGGTLQFSATAASTAGAVTSLRFDASGDGTAFTSVAEGVFQSGVWSGTWTPPAPGKWFVRAVAADVTARSKVSLARVINTGGGGWNAWLDRYFTAAELNDPAVSGPAADADRDSVPNLAEYASGTDPRNASSAAVPVSVLVPQGGNAHPGIVFRTAAGAAEVLWSVEVSNDLAAWNSGAGTTAIVSTTVNPDGTQTIIVRDNQPVLTPGKRWLRLRVRLP